MVGRRATVVALVVAAAALVAGVTTGGGLAQAAPRCNVPDPPPACDGGSPDPSPSTSTPTPPSSPSPVAPPAPELGVASRWIAFHRAPSVTPYLFTPSTVPVTGAVLQQGASAAGPWTVPTGYASDTVPFPVSLPNIYYASTLDRQCFRARLFNTVGSSPWTVLCPSVQRTGPRGLTVTRSAFLADGWTVDVTYQDDAPDDVTVLALVDGVAVPGYGYVAPAGNGTYLGPVTKTFTGLSEGSHCVQIFQAYAGSGPLGSAPPPAGNVPFCFALVHPAG
jgi:hypothetical protein